MTDPSPGIGHNSTAATDPSRAKDRLKSYVDRIERLDEERRALGSDIRDIFKEAKSAGFDVTALRELVKSRRIPATDYENFRLLLDFYRSSLD